MAWPAPVVGPRPSAARRDGARSGTPMIDTRPKSGAALRAQPGEGRAPGPRPVPRSQRPAMHPGPKPAGRFSNPGPRYVPAEVRARDGRRKVSRSTARGRDTRKPFEVWERGGAMARQAAAPTGRLLVSEGNALVSSSSRTSPCPERPNWPRHHTRNCGLLCLVPNSRVESLATVRGTRNWRNGPTAVQIYSRHGICPGADERIVSSAGCSAALPSG